MLQGIGWTASGQFFNHLLTFILGIILARILTPNDFGLLGMITVFTGFAETVKDFGISSALIHKKELKENELSSTFWLSLGIGIVLAIVFGLLSKPIAVFYGNDILRYITFFIALNFIFSSASIAQQSLLQKKLDFKGLVYITFFSELIASSLAIILAWYGWGVWSLVHRILCKTILSGLLYWIRSAWYPAFHFSFSDLRDIFSFSIPLFGTRAMNYWVRNLDDLLIGRLIGASALGNYTRAYSLMRFPLIQITKVMDQVYFPVLSQPSVQVSTVKSIFFKTNRLSAFIFLPVMAGLSILAPDFIWVLLGEKWLDVIPLLRILALAGLLQSIVVVIGGIFMITGETKVQFRLGLFTSSISVIALLVGIRWGATGVAWGLFAATIICFIPNIFYAGRIIDINLIQWLSNLWEITLSTAFMSLGIWLLHPYLAEFSPFSRLLLNILNGFIIYIGLLILIKPPVFKDLKEIFDRLAHEKN